LQVPQQPTEHQPVVVVDLPAQRLHELIAFLPQYTERQIGNFATSGSPVTSSFNINPPRHTQHCGFRAKWGTDSDGKWGGISTEVGRGFDGKWGTLGCAVVMVPHFLRNGDPINFGRLPTSIGTSGQG
jgi:hypothetical protein